jgi:hypothetical protein
VQWLVSLMTLVSLPDNNIGVEGAVSLAEALKLNNTLTELLSVI